MLRSLVNMDPDRAHVLAMLLVAFYVGLMVVREVLAMLAMRAWQKRAGQPPE